MNCAIFSVCLGHPKAKATRKGAAVIERACCEQRPVQPVGRPATHAAVIVNSPRYGEGRTSPICDLASAISTEHGYEADPTDMEMLPYLAERHAEGEDGAVLVCDRTALLAAHGDRLQAIEPGTDWGMDMDDEEEDRLLHDDDFLDDMLRHVKRIIITNSSRFAQFKAFVLSHNKNYAKAFARIARLAK